MSQQTQLLVVGQLNEHTNKLIELLQPACSVQRPPTLTECLQQLGRQNCDSSAVMIVGEGLPIASGILLERGGILEQMPSGVALLNEDQKIIWANSQLAKLTDSSSSLKGQGFYDAFGTPAILGPDFNPFTTALATGEPASSHLRVGEKTYFEIEVVPVSQSTDGTMLVTVRDVSDDVHQRQKLNAIYQAGLELGDLSPQEIFDMSVDDRVELLKQRILHYTQDLLEFETVEIRLLGRGSELLEPLLECGMDTEAAERTLYARPKDNGVTGFVAATGKSYLCEDTLNDPLYLTGASSTRSSLTVPLILHDEILGSFNVESPEPGVFDQTDLQFLELFSREVAVALNTLDLLLAEKATTATQSSERLLREVASPVDEILNDAAWVLERYIGHEPNVCDRLRRILQRTRDIRQMIHRVGESMTPQSAANYNPERQQRPKLREKRVLVVDADDTVRSAAHELLGRYGCEVETAHSGEEAFLMTRSFHYDLVIADIRLTDMTGYECFCELQRIHAHLPIILMTGYGYDPTHSIVKARQAGLKAVLYKPFRLDQLLTEVENAVNPATETNAST